MKKPKVIENWVIRVKWSDGIECDLPDIPDDVASAIDSWLTEVEMERNTDENKNI